MVLSKTAVQNGLQALRQWKNSQPVVRWVATEFEKAGEREFATRQWLYRELGDLWAKSFYAGHRVTQAAGNHLPIKPLQKVSHTVAQQLHRAGTVIRNTPVTQKILGYVAFKGVWDTAFYAAGGKGLLVAAHLLPAAGASFWAFATSPFSGLALLSGAAMVKPAKRYVQQQLHTQAHVLKKPSAKQWAKIQSQTNIAAVLPRLG
jgi:hypothetical protein